MRFIKRENIAGIDMKRSLADIMINRILTAALTFALFAAFCPSPAAAVTAEELKPAVFEALGHSVPQKYFSGYEGPLTHKDAMRLCLEAMGWDFVIRAIDQIGILPEWPEAEGVSFIAKTISPAPPEALVLRPDEPLEEETTKALSEWLEKCSENVRWKASFAYNDTELIMIKRGIGDPEGPANGDIENGKNEPLFAALLAVDMKNVPCQIATAVMVGANKAPLATIAAENFGVIGGINGGYFAGAKPIGVLRRQGYTDSAKFWPNRSAFGWNENGEYIFIDGKYTASISGDHRFDKFTEVLQAGPLLIKDGAPSPNTEKIHPSVLDLRHPRTFVASSGKRIFWGVVDGRDSMHSVGMTIEELRTFCSQLSFISALNLDGGGSSSLWWRGMTFSLPSNASDRERPIPYAILMFEPGSGVRQ